MEMLRTKMSLLLWHYGLFVVLWLKGLLGHAVEAEEVENVLEDLPVVMVHNPAKKAVNEEPTMNAYVEDPTKKVVNEEPTMNVDIDDPTKMVVIEEPTMNADVEDPTKKVVIGEPTMNADVEDPTKKADIEVQAQRRLKVQQKKRLKKQQKRRLLKQAKKIELPTTEQAEMEDSQRKTTHPDGFLKKFPGSDSKVVEASLKHPAKQMVFTRGIMWDVTPPLLGIRGNQFSLVTRAVYFPSSIDWQCDASVRLTFSCQEDPSIRIEGPEENIKASNLSSSVLIHRIQKPAKWSKKKWEKLDWFKIEVTVDNFEGHCDSVPSLLPLDVEDPSIRHDRVLIIEGRKIYVQSGILSMWSDYFNSMFNSSFKEASMKEIVIDDLSADEFIEMLKVIYPCENSITVESLESLLALADLLIMPCLTIKCSLFMSSLPKGTLNIDKIRYLTDAYRLLQIKGDGKIDKILKKSNYLTTDDWNSHFKSALKVLQLDLERSTVPHDRVIVIQGRRIHVQSAMLASHSSYFASLFDTIEDPTQDILLTDVSADEFIELVHCIYPYGKPVEDCDMEVLLRLAKQFEIPSLTDKCGLYLCTLEYRDMQLIPMAELAFEYKLDQFKCWLFAKANRGMHGCMDTFRFKKRELLESLPDEIKDFFEGIFVDWGYISCPFGSDCHPNPDPFPTQCTTHTDGTTVYYCRNQTSQLLVIPY